MVELNKDNARFGLGFSIAGGKGSTPAYEDVDEVMKAYKLHHFQFQFLEYIHHKNHKRRSG